MLTFIVGFLVLLFIALVVWIFNNYLLEVISLVIVIGVVWLVIWAIHTLGMLMLELVR
jgi:hypothetical protein